jgi:hypothetical protein
MEIRVSPVYVLSLFYLTLDAQPTIEKQAKKNTTPINHTTPTTPQKMLRTVHKIPPFLRILH